MLISTDKVLSLRKIYREIDISQWSRNITKLRRNKRKLPNKVFSAKFTSALLFLILANLFYIQTMASGNLPPQRREFVVRGDGNCF